MNLGNIADLITVKPRYIYMVEDGVSDGVFDTEREAVAEGFKREYKEAISTSLYVADTITIWTGEVEGLYIDIDPENFIDDAYSSNLRWNCVDEIVTPDTISSDALSDLKDMLTDTFFNWLTKNEDIHKQIYGIKNTKVHSLSTEEVYELYVKEVK